MEASLLWILPTGIYTFVTSAVSRSNLCDQVAVKEEGGDPCRDINYLEPDIDSVRALKDEVSTQ